MKINWVQEKITIELKITIIQLNEWGNHNIFIREISKNTHNQTHCYNIATHVYDTCSSNNVCADSSTKRKTSERFSSQACSFKQLLCSFEHIKSLNALISYAPFARFSIPHVCLSSPSSYPVYPTYLSNYHIHTQSSQNFLKTYTHKWTKHESSRI